MELSRSAHRDTFARDRLPPPESWPALEFTLPELRYPERLNAAHELLDATIARLGPDRTAIRAVDGGIEGASEITETWTYGSLRDRVDQVARLLTEEHGLVPGNRVLLRIPNNPWAVVCWLALVKAGAIAVTTMVAWRSAELTKVAALTRPDLVIIDHRYLEAIDGVFDAHVPVLTLGGPDDEVAAASRAKPTGFGAVDTAADDVALFAPTSGTTGDPKVTVHFHRDVLAIADTFARHVLRIRPDDVVVGSPPLAFTFGLGGLMIFPFRFGASSLLLERPGPGALADAIEAHGATMLMTAPTGYRTMLQEGRADALRRLRVGVSAGEHLPRETFEAVEAAAGLRLVNGIGSTEMLHVFISAAGEDIVPGAIGRAVPGFRATILDDEGDELPPGRIGRLAVIGPTGCRYLSDPRQAVYTRNGWNVTGDACMRDERGYFFYQARADDMIVAAGYNIGAPEVEAAVDAHPSVSESVVVARPDREKGAVVNAFVVLVPGAPADDATRESIKQSVAERLARYKVPRRIDFVDALPRNASGKLLRSPLRRRAEEEAGRG